MFCKNRITLIGFLGQDAESRSTPNGTVFTRLSLANQHELERERQQRIQDAHRMAPYRLLEQAGRLGPAPCRKVLTWRSKANCAIATILPRKPIAACAWRRFTPTRSWRW